MIIQSTGRSSIALFLLVSIVIPIAAVAQSGVERGVRNPTVSVLAELAAALGVPPHCLLEPEAEGTGSAGAATKPEAPGSS